MQFRDSKCVIYAVSQIKDMSYGSDVRKWIHTHFLLLSIILESFV